MSRQFKLKQFLRNLNSDLVQEYFEHTGISITFPDQKNETSRLAALEATLLALPEAQIAQIEADFIDINDLATEGGIQSLLELARHRQALAAQIGEIENVHNKTLYCFLHDPDLFKEASVLYYVVDLKSKAERVGLHQRSIAEVMQKSIPLSLTLSTYLNSQEGRGKHCEVEIHEFADRVCFIAHPENYPESDLCYESAELKRVTRRPSFEIIYVYYPEGKLELAASGGKKRQLALFNAFNQAVLDDARPVQDNQLIYDLSILLNPEFELVLNPADQLEKAALKQLRLASKYNHKNRVTIEVDGADGLTTMREEIKHRNIDPSWYTVTQATFQFKFPGSGNKGKVTMQLSNPDRNNLNDTPYHQRAKKYIQTWGLLNDSNIPPVAT